MKILHTADLHFQNQPDILTEVRRVAASIVGIARSEIPDVIILAGDTMDEHHGRIRLDSEAARAAIEFVTKLAWIAPVVVIRGTKSHDREAPYIFAHLNTRHPVHVASDPEQVALLADSFGGQTSFVPVDGGIDAGLHRVALFTLLPSLDKQYMAATFSGGIREGNANWREMSHDLLSGFGLVNQANADLPRILVGHGMVTGSTFSSGQEAVGEDLEWGVDTLSAAGCDYVALGHVHRCQSFGGRIYYSGSPGRLNFGEPEEKVVLLVDVEPGADPVVRPVKTPAREFLFSEVEWDGPESITSALQDLLPKANGCHVRFRYSVPEEHRHAVSRDDIEAEIIRAGAVLVKVECQIIPAQRQRAAGISNVQTLQEKVKRWGETTGVDVPDRALAIAGEIEGLEAEELRGRFCHAGN